MRRTEVPKSKSNPFRLTDEEKRIVMLAGEVYKYLERTEGKDAVEDYPVVVMDEKGVVRSHTKNAREPSLAQIIQRVKFAMAAKAAAGKPPGENGLSPACIAVKEQLTGDRAGVGYRDPPSPKWIKEVEAWLREKSSLTSGEKEIIERVERALLKLENA